MGKKSKKQKDVVAGKRANTPEHKELSKASKKELMESATNLLEFCSKPIPPGPKEIEDFPEIFSMVEKIRSIQTDVTYTQPERGTCISAFIEWLNNNKVDTLAIEIENFQHVGYGIKATKDLKEMDPFVIVPRKLMLTTDTARASGLDALIAEDKILQAMPSIVLALHLLCERRSTESFWRPYLDMLPSRYTTPLYFSPEELALLKGSPAYKDCVNQYRNIARQYAYFYRVLQNHPAASKLPIKDCFTYDDYRWAVSTVMTRQNQVPTPDGERLTFALIPLWDMCNHCNGTITTDYNVEDDCSECFALRDFAKGEQIMIFYGARSNAELLIHSGFVYPDNEWDRIAVKLGISKGDPLFDSKSDLLTKLGLEVSRSFFIHRGRFPLDPQILAFLRIFCMSEENLKELQSSPLTEEKMESLGEVSTPVSIENDEKVWSFLETRTALLQKAYDTTAEEDEELIKSSDYNENQKLLICLRRCEKRILLSTQTYAKTMKETLISKQNKD
ncbi:actin-histidine N-methyltransferase-like [Ylistrum balloti]|uniref:actin-histidine N-methyltransferase-like n=1 Tax=Ylistrum balloti TaxID=509963 RepID=UPI002905C2EB|nr:actin-histidine N-methyltransferase-like [Ylistrum balloti]